jgi:hypothetical protein
MALDTKENLGGNGSEAAAPLLSLDGDLVNQYLELQVSMLNLQLEAARRAAAASGDDAAMATSTGRLWHEAAPTAAIVLLIGGAVGLLSALNWSEVWHGLSYGQPGDLMFVTSGTATVSGQFSAVANFTREWKDVLLSIAGGGVLLGLKRLAYRSVRSAVVIVLAVILGFSLLAGLVFADIHLVKNALTPLHVSWRGWATLGVAIVAGVVLYNELCDIAQSSPESFQPRSPSSGSVSRWISWVTTATWIGRFLEWLATPRGGWRWLASAGIVTAITIALCIPVLIGGIISGGADSWSIAFAMVLPVGPVWWLLFLAVVASSPTGRQPSATQVAFTIFTAAPALALCAFVAVLLSPGAYDASGNVFLGYALLAALAFEVWGFWFLWAGIALSTPLRIVFLPVVLLIAVTVPMYFGLLPFLGLITILTIGVPWSLWRARRALAAA